MTSSSSSRHHTKRRILRNTSANAVAQAVTTISTFIFLPLLIRAFTLPAYGVMVLATSVATFATLLDLGIGATLVRVVAERNAVGDHPGVTRAVFSAAGIYGVVGIIVALLMVGLGMFGRSLFNVTAGEAPLLTTLLFIGAVVQLWAWPTSAVRSALSGLQRYDLVASVTIFTALADAAAIVVVLVMHLGPVVLVIARGVEVVASTLVQIVLLRGLLPKAARRVSASIADMKAMLKAGSSIFALQIAHVLTRQQADKIVLGVFIGPAAVGLYDIAAKLNTLVSMLIGLCASATLPVAAELHASAEHDALRSLFIRGTKIIATVAAPVIVILIAISGAFISAWCGPGYAVVVPVAMVLLLAQILLPLYELGDQILIAKNRFHLFVPAGLTCAVINVVLSVTLVHIWGITGVAAGTLGAMMIEFPWFARIFGKEMDLPISKWLRQTAWPIYPLLIVPAALAYLGARSALGGSILGLAAVGAISLATFWVIVLFAAYSPAERADFMSVLLKRIPSAEAAG
jgi:O-antigen/teichoic acid export membrane protein